MLNSSLATPSKEWADASKPLHMQALGRGGARRYSSSTASERAQANMTYRNNKKIIGFMCGLELRRVAFACRSLAFMVGPGSRSRGFGRHRVLFGQFGLHAARACSHAPSSEGVARHWASIVDNPHQVAGGDELRCGEVPQSFIFRGRRKNCLCAIGPSHRGTRFWWIWRTCC